MNSRQAGLVTDVTASKKIKTFRKHQFLAFNDNSKVLKGQLIRNMRLCDVIYNDAWNL
jgi:hypothetical protein